MTAAPDETAVAVGMEEHHLDKIGQEVEEFLQLKELNPLEQNLSSNNTPTSNSIGNVPNLPLVNIGTP